MPMRAFRASKTYAGTHVKANLRLWAGILAALGAAAMLLFRSNSFGLGSLWGDLLVLCGMILGVLIIVISHEGYEAPEVVDDQPPAA